MNIKWKSYVILAFFFKKKHCNLVPRVFVLLTLQPTIADYGRLWVPQAGRPQVLAGRVGSLRRRRRGKFWPTFVQKKVRNFDSKWLLMDVFPKYEDIEYT